MKDVQCHELFGGIALKNHAFSFFLNIANIKAYFSVSWISRRSQDSHNIDVNLATLSLGDITGFKTVVSDYLSTPSAISVLSLPSELLVLPVVLHCK